MSNTLQTTLTWHSEYEMESKFEVYPNPFRNELMIRSIDHLDEVESISVFDVYGKQITVLNKIAQDNGQLILRLP